MLVYGHDMIHAQDLGDEVHSTLPTTSIQVACAGFYVPARLMLRWSYRAVVGGLGNLVAAVSSDMIPGPALTGFYVRGGLAPVSILA